MPDRFHRLSIRLKDYDYSQVGVYFVTICTADRAFLFGEIIDGKMRLNGTGQIAEEVWLAIPEHFANVSTDGFVVMPNHVHGILVISDVGATGAVGATHASPVQINASPLQIAHRPNGPKPRSIGAVVGTYNSAASKRINKMRSTPGLTVWHRNYFEHIIRNEKTLHRIRKYINNNPARWHVDQENPTNVK